MRGLILAAGRGSRMKDMTTDKPKCMLTIKKKPLIQHQIDSMTAAGISAIAVVGGYLYDKIKATPITARFVNERWAETNMVRSLMAATSWLEQDDCVITYSDIFYKPEAISSLRRNSANIAITFDTNFIQLWTQRFDDPFSDLESFKISSDYRLLDIGSRITKNDTIDGQYMGLIKTTPNGWNQLFYLLKTFNSETLDKLDMTSLFKLAIKSGIQIGCVPYTLQWGEVDQARDLALYETWSNL